jgi:uncharacterized protein (DUF58 family)
LIPSRFALALLGALALLFVFGFVDPVFTWVGLAADGAVLGLVVVDAWLASRTPVTVERRLGSRLHQGEPAVVRRGVSHRASRRTFVRLRDVLAPELVQAPYELAWALAPGRERIAEQTIRPRVRGDVELPPAACRVRGPLGLAWAERSVGRAERIRVLPKAHLEGDAGLLVQQAMRRQLGAHPIARRGISSEMYGVREYLPGDEYRMIHWKASARLNRPVTLETTWERHQQLVVMIDCGRAMASRAGEHSKLDHTLAAVLALLRVVVAQQDSALLVMFSHEVRTVLAVDRRTRSFSPIFEAVFDEQPELTEPDYTAVSAWCARRVPRRSLAVMCTSVLDLVAADVLASALTGLATRHQPLLVNLQDPALIDTARSIPEDVQGSFAKTTAMGMLAANKELETRLRSAGVDTVTRPASRLAVGVIQAYLDAKARRRF